VEGFADPEFLRVRHLNVPLLDDPELSQVANQSTDLKGVLDLARGPFRELLRVPFNLSLVAAILESGTAAAELTPIRTQLELFDRYWAARVIRDDRKGDAREVILRRVAEEMVRRRGLRVPRRTVVTDGADAEPLRELLSANVLAEWRGAGASRPDESLLVFSHHLLFDYAVARLLLRGDPQDLIGRLEENPDLALAIRPSLVLHFQHVWAEDPARESFWDLVGRFARSGRVPEIAKTIGPAVAMNLFSSANDVLPLMNQLGGQDEH